MRYTSGIDEVEVGDGFFAKTTAADAIFA
jgi:hypothetical protein